MGAVVAVAGLAGEGMSGRKDAGLRVNRLPVRTKRRRFPKPRGLFKALPLDKLPKRVIIG
jgi:hypothetical protein